MNRVFTVLLYPVFTFFTENSFLQLSNISFLEDIAYSGYDLFKDIIMPEEQSNLQQIFSTVSSPPVSNVQYYDPQTMTK